PATLADETDNDDVGGGEARHHAEQHALAHAAAGEQAHALAAADGEQRIDGAYAHIERFTDGTARHGIDGTAGQRNACRGVDGTLAVQRHAGTVDDAAQQAI